MRSTAVNSCFTTHTSSASGYINPISALQGHSLIFHRASDALTNRCARSTKYGKHGVQKMMSTEYTEQGEQRAPKMVTTEYQSAGQLPISLRS